MNPQITTTNANRYNTEESIVSSRPHATEIRVINSLSQFDRFLTKAIKTNVQKIYTCLLSIFSPKWFAVSFSAACKEQLQNKVALLYFSELSPLQLYLSAQNERKPL